MILDRIVDVKRQEVARLRESLNVSEALNQIAGLPPTRGFINALRSAQTEVALIAEVKKASPSKGVIRPDFDPVAIAKQYEAAGASAISVLTDEQFFQGSGSYLGEIRKEVGLPLLRKDFIIDELQIYEARMLGADAILLITAILSVDEIRRFQSLAADLGLDALVEVHDRQELASALAAEARLIGVNNRDLRTFDVDLNTTVEVAKQLPEGSFLVSESGIFTYHDIQFVRQAGASAVLIGESLMRADSIPSAIDQLLGRKTEV
ncbi:indole-3-glycerol phosphate synthase TrpC [Effusibacillus dendaii]|uniref:Indole-3-glycerol phosphate synthase n=1 Tax=Effusibacillus dendaii TaxID=2743772 RepID=A0A7I8DA48_9BACL|nr:indole-3-glycerol phosphate synthase TrpC [Effusibacillus dendaii]BCJ85400.1 indole-3-glycerol-phosphate synthase [Effusibacillus dendaii]